MEFDPQIEIISSYAVPLGFAVFFYEKRAIGVLRLGVGKIPPEHVKFDQVFFNPIDFADLKERCDDQSTSH